MFKKGLILVLSILTVFMMLGGCASSPSGANVSQTDGGTALFGQITAIDGNSITIKAGSQQERPQMNGSQNGADATSSATTGDGEQPNGPQGGNFPSGDTSRGDGNAQGGNPPSGGTSRDDGNAPGGSGRGFGGMTFTGEEQTITVTDSTVITVQSGNSSEAGSLSDLAVGSIVSVEMTNGTVTGITVMQIGMDRGANAPNQSGDDNSQAGNTGSPA